MRGLARRKQTTITVGGVEYPISTDFRAALDTWSDFEDAYNGECSHLTATMTAFRLMLNIDYDDDVHAYIAQGVIDALMEYFTKHSRISDAEKPDNSRPLIDFEQDENLIRDAFMLLKVDLYDDEMDFSAFMSNFRNIHTTDAQLCRIVYLRQLIRDGKISKKEHKAEREEIKRIGADIVILRKKRSKREQEEIENRRQQNRERFKNVRAQ